MRLTYLTLLLSVIAASLALAPTASAAAPAVTRWIVLLTEKPVVEQYPGRIEQTRAGAAPYRQHLQAVQASLRPRIEGTQARVTGALQQILGRVVHPLELSAPEVLRADARQQELGRDRLQEAVPHHGPELAAAAEQDVDGQVLGPSRSAKNQRTGHPCGTGLRSGQGPRFRCRHHRWRDDGFHSHHRRQPEADPEPMAARRHLVVAARPPWRHRSHRFHRCLQSPRRRLHSGDAIMRGARAVMAHRHRLAHHG